jgi:predicted RNase H-like HicB family nuclease
MLTEYISAAMRLATFSVLEDTGEYWGEIPGFDGLWAVGDTTDECRAELRSALEDWVLFMIASHLPLPSAAGIELAVPNVA